jgi:hypothetical protein
VFSSDPNLNAFLVFSNLAVGKALQFFYHYFTAVAWYDIMQTAAIFVTCVVSYYSIARTAPSRIVVVVSALSLGGLLIGVSVRHQFTIIASCLTGAGIALLLSEFVKPAQGRREAAVISAIAATCMIVGSLMRFDSFLLCVLVSLPALALTFFESREPRSWLWPTVTLSICVIAAVSFNGVDKRIYHDNVEWAHFAEHNRARTNLTEYLQLDDGRIPKEVMRRMESTDSRVTIATFWRTSSSATVKYLVRRS